jgi:Fe-S cluster biogenesis protein NfuA
MTMETQEIRITAQPEANQQRCKFTVDRPVYEGRIGFTDRMVAENSPLAKKLFELGKVARVDFQGAVVLVTQDGTAEWSQLARHVGATIRNHLKAGEPVLNPGWKPVLTPDEALREKIQSVLDTEINPAVAGHGGFIEVTEVHDRKVFLKMGGGCQGCGSADVTLKQGVEKMLFERVPEIASIHDSTDHAAGANPYYTAQH